MPKWIEMELGDFIELKRGYDLPQKDRTAGSIPIVSSSGKSGLHGEFKVKGPGVITGRYGTIGEVFYCEEDFWPLNTTLYVKDFKGNDPLFTYYFLKTIRFSDYSDKAAVPGINRNHLHKAIIKVPSDPVYQKELASKLWDLDKKIQLNTQTNQTLESIAQAIFKSWFVDFEPVKAKMTVLAEGGTREHAELAGIGAISGKSEAELAQLQQQNREHYQQLSETAALFPSAMVESELGEIPEGWEAGCIGDIALAKGGYAFKSNEFEASGSKVIKIKNITGDGRVDLLDCDCVREPQPEKLNKFKVLDGDLLMAMTGATVGKIGIAVSGNDCVYLNQRVAKFDSKIKTQKVSWFLFPCIQQKSVFDTIVGSAQGSAQPNISSSEIERTEIVVPDENLVSEYCELVDPIFKKWMANNILNIELANIRDSLLPKLLSGEVNLTEIQSEVA